MPEDPPDPAGSRTQDELVARLRLLKAWAGNPSYAAIAERVNAAWRSAGMPAREWVTAKNTVADCFQVRPRPNDELMMAVVGALAPDRAYVAGWRRTLRAVRGGAEAASFVTALDRLPAPLPSFVGRAAETDCILRLAEGGGPVVISAIEGMPGVGKTSLAVHAGHRLLDRGAFDQVLFVDLRGFHPDPAQPPADPAAVLAEFLRLLGLPADRIQRLDLDRRAEVYRRLLRPRRALVVLDNAAGAGQVSDLVPDGPRCLTLVTSRRTLAGLTGARHLPLDVFTPDEALDVLRSAAGTSRFDDDPGAAALIAELLGRLPLALGVAAGRISARRWSLAEHLEALLTRHELGGTPAGAGAGAAPAGLPEDRVERAGALRVEDRVRLALGLSYEGMPPATRRLFRLLALHPGPDLDAPAAAALAGTDRDTARRHLDAALAASLLQQRQPGRYLLHDVVRAFALDRALDEERAGDRRAALTGLLDHYRYLAAAAVDVLIPAGKDRRPAVTAQRHPAVPPADRAAAQAWLTAELPNLLACTVHAADWGWPRHAVDLAAVLRGYLDGRALYAEGVAVQAAALRAAGEDGDLAGQAAAYRGLGLAHGRRGDYGRAAGLHERALAAYRELGDRTGEAVALSGLGVVHDRWGRYEQAAEYYRRAADLYRDSGDHGGQGHSMVNLGNVYQRWGRYAEALANLRDGLELQRAAGDRRGEGSALTYLGHLHQRWGQLEEAQDCYERALALRRTTGDRYGEAYALTYLGTVHGQRGRYEQAGDHLRRALAVHREIGARSDEGRALTYLGLLQALLGDHDQGAAHLDDALALALDIGDRDLEIEALNGLGDVARGAGRLAEALDHHRAALGVGTGDRHQQAQANLALARTWQALGELDQAREHARQALALYADLGVPAAEQAREFLANLDGGGSGG